MQETSDTPEYMDVPADETINQLTHAAGLMLSIAGAWHLLTQVPMNGYLTLGIWIYAIALVGLFAASTLSHSFVAEPRRTRWRTLDQIAIFTVIAGTYTPVSMAVCGDGWWNLPLVLMWLLAGIGIYLKLRITKHEMVPVWFYVGVASIPMVAIPRYLQFSTSTIGWIIAGALCYLLGVFFLTNDRKVPYFHAVWHVLVIMGSTCHYIVVWNYTATLG